MDIERQGPGTYRGPLGTVAKVVHDPDNDREHVWEDIRRPRLDGTEVGSRYGPQRSNLLLLSFGPVEDNRQRPTRFKKVKSNAF